MGRRSRGVIVRALSTVLFLGALAAYVAVAADGGTGAAHAGVLVHPPLSVLSVDDDTVSSTNWSGYAVESASAFTDVTGTWTEPSGTCSMLQPTYSSFWVGLDGYNSASVEQLGTDVDCSWNGTPSYYAWWEMYPAGSVSLSTSAYPVKPNDTLTADVTRSGTTYTLMLSSSEGWKFQTSQTGSGANSSAEWVAEAPQICTVVFCHGARLTDFGSVPFSGSVAATGGASAPISSFTADSGPHRITMVSVVGATRSQPGPLTSGGAGFVDVWKSS